MVEREGGERLAGTLLGVWRKLSAAQRRRGEESFVLVPLQRSQRDVAMIMRELDEIVREMATATDIVTSIVTPMTIAEASRVLVPNRRSCVQWNWRCQYFGVCHAGASLSDPEFVDLEDRYAAIAEVGE